MTKILMVEDNPNVLHLNRSLVERQGYHVLAAENLTQAKILVREHSDVALAVLDIMLPDGDGLTYAKELKRTVGCPVLMLTSKRSHSDIVEGLTSGADDYLTKPYRIEELTARIQVLLQKPHAEISGVLKYGALRLDIASGSAFLHGENLMLQPRELALLVALLQRKGRFVTAEALYEAAWRMPASGDTGALKTAVSRLRGKLAGSGYLIESERGSGYRLVEE